jgi:hypothetical protein
MRQGCSDELQQNTNKKVALATRGELSGGERWDVLIP